MIFEILFKIFGIFFKISFKVFLRFLGFLRLFLRFLKSPWKMSVSEFDFECENNHGSRNSSKKCWNYVILYVVVGLVVCNLFSFCFRFVAQIRRWKNQAQKPKPQNRCLKYSSFIHENILPCLSGLFEWITVFMNFNIFALLKVLA